MAPTVNLLLVEDDEVDIQGLKRAFTKSRIGNPITVARDGIEALEILRGQNGREKLAKPHLILLDLNMPRMNGIEFPEAIRNDNELKTTVVFMITTSKAETSTLFSPAIAAIRITPPGKVNFTAFPTRLRRTTSSISRCPSTETPSHCAIKVRPLSFARSANSVTIWSATALTSTGARMTSRELICAFAQENKLSISACARLAASTIP
jgi:CheY-like chemotaxis protein